VLFILRQSASVLAGNAHWDYHRQMLAIQQDKFSQFNLMTAARDDLYRQRREAAYRRRIERYNDQNEAKAAWTEEFYLKKDFSAACTRRGRGRRA